MSNSENSNFTWSPESFLSSVSNPENSNIEEIESEKDEESDEESENSVNDEEIENSVNDEESNNQFNQFQNLKRKNVSIDSDESSDESTPPKRFKKNDFSVVPKNILNNNQVFTTIGDKRLRPRINKNLNLDDLWNQQLYGTRYVPFNNESSKNLNNEFLDNLNNESLDNSSISSIATDKESNGEFENDKSESMYNFNIKNYYPDRIPFELQDGDDGEKKLEKIKKELAELGLQNVENNTISIFGNFKPTTPKALFSQFEKHLFDVKNLAKSIILMIQNSLQEGVLQIKVGDFLENYRMVTTSNKVDGLEIFEDFTPDQMPIVYLPIETTYVQVKQNNKFYSNRINILKQAVDNLNLELQKSLLNSNNNSSQNKNEQFQKLYNQTLEAYEIFKKDSSEHRNFIQTQLNKLRDEYEKLKNEYNTLQFEFQTYNDTINEKVNWHKELELQADLNNELSIFLNRVDIRPYLTQDNFNSPVDQTKKLIDDLLILKQETENATKNIQVEIENELRISKEVLQQTEIELLNQYKNFTAEINNKNELIQNLQNEIMKSSEFENAVKEQLERMQDLLKKQKGDQQQFTIKTANDVKILFDQIISYIISKEKKSSDIQRINSSNNKLKKINDDLQATIKKLTEENLQQRSKLANYYDTITQQKNQIGILANSITETEGDNTRLMNQYRKLDAKFRNIERQKK
jgi:hypothetical protein